MDLRKKKQGLANTVQAERRMKIAEMHLNGKSMRQIAKDLGKSVGCIHRDIDALREQWKERAAESIERVTAELLAHHWRNYYELRAAFEASKGEQSTIQTVAIVKVEDGKRVVTGERATKTVTVSQGDLSYMAAAEACLDKIARLTGAYKPTKIARTTPDGEQPAGDQNLIIINLHDTDPAELSPEELEAQWTIINSPRFHQQQQPDLESPIDSPRIIESVSMPSATAGNAPS